MRASSAGGLPGSIVEVDGAYHTRRPRADERRELKLRRLGIRIARVSAQLVLTDLAAAVALVRAALQLGR